jgi:hypothetical protein
VRCRRVNLCQLEAESSAMATGEPLEDMQPPPLEQRGAEQGEAEEEEQEIGDTSARAVPAAGRSAAQIVRSLAWLRPTGLYYSNPEMLHRSRKRRHACEAHAASAKRAAHRSPRPSHRSPPRQQATSKHARESPKSARRPLTTDRRARAAAAAFVVGTPCENCSEPMQRCFGSGRFCGQTCASKFSRVGRAATASSPQGSPGAGKKSAGVGANPPQALGRPGDGGQLLPTDSRQRAASAAFVVGTPCENCGEPMQRCYGSGRFCQQTCAAKFSRVGRAATASSPQGSPGAGKKSAGVGANPPQALGRVQVH